VPTEPVGRFRLVEEIGRGGMGVVYRAVDTATSVGGEGGEEVAVKVLLAGEHGNEESVARFLREAEAAAAIRHPHLVPVREHGWDDGRPYLVMDLVDGPTVEEVVASGGPVEPRRAAELASGLARGLHCAHRHGIVHRDVKPGNVLLEAEDHARLTDFGLVIEADAKRITRTGQVLGTPTYMAPEQATSHRDTPAELSDQYSLGAVLYEMLTGHPPYVGDTAAQVLVTLVGRPPRPLRSVTPDVPLDLVTIVETAMAREPSRRYPDCAAMADDLDRFLRGQRVVAQPQPAWERLVEHAMRHRAAWLAVLATLGVVTGAAVGFLVVADLRSSRVEASRQAEAVASLAALRPELAELPRERRQAALSDWLADDGRRGTHAGVIARLEEADRLLADRASDAAATWYGEAFADASEPQLQRRALEGLVHAFGWSWRSDDLAAATQVLRSRLPADAPASASARVLLARHDLPTAARRLAADHPDAAKLLDALTPARPTPHAPTTWRAVDLDGDPTTSPQVAAEGDGRVDLLALAPGGPVLTAQIELPDGVAGLHLLATDPPTLLGHRAAPAPHGELVLIDTSGEELLTVPDAAALDAVAADLDGDGRTEIYAGIGPYARHLRVLRPASAAGADAWQATEGPRALVDAASDVTALHVTSSDPPQLWVASGAWRGYDLRRYVADGRGELAQLDRRKHGYVSQLVAVDDRLALVDSDLYPSRIGFGPGQEYGVERGVWLLDPEANTFEHLVVPGPPDTLLGPLFAADLDGDDDTDLALALSAGSRHATALWAQTSEGWSGPWLISGLLPTAAGNLDADEAAELMVVRPGTDEAWVLGSGDGQLPVAAPHEHLTPRPPPPSLHPRHRARWTRAEDLATMGLRAEAAAMYEDLVQSLPASSTASRAAAMARAGELLGHTGDRIGGARQLAEAAALDPAWQPLATEVLSSAHLVAEAAELGAEPPAWLASETTLDLRADDGLRTIDPVAIRRRPGGTRWSAVAPGPPLARRQVEWSGDHLRLDLSVAVDHVEWGSGIVVSLQPSEGEPVELGIRGWGGGTWLEREIGCLQPAAPHPRRPAPSASVEATWSLRADWLDGELLCSVTGPDGQAATQAIPWPLSRGRLVVEVRAAEHAGVAAYTLATAEVHDLTLTGPGLAPAPTGGPPLDARRQRLWAIADGAEASPRELARLARAFPDELPRLIRLRTPTFTPQLVEALGVDALAPFARAFDTAMHNHPDDALTVRAHTSATDALLQLSVGDAPFAVRLAAATIRARRGAAWRRLDQPDAAQRDLRTAADTVERLAASTSEAQRPQVRGLGFQIHAELASLAAEAGADRVARAEIARAIDWHVAPDVARDVLAARSELTPLVAP